MHIFRRQTFRKLASILAMTLLLGGTASVWASVENLLDNKPMQSSGCHTQMQDKQHMAGNCCADNGDCMNLCGSCSVPVSVSIFTAISFPAFELTSKPVHFSLSDNIPDGTSSGFLYRPPILPA